MNWAAIKSLCASIALLAAAFLAVNTVLVENRLEKHLSQVAMRVGDTVDKVNATLEAVNRTGGILQTAGKAVADAKNLIGHTDILVAKEQKSLDTWNEQITTTLGHVNIAVTTTTANETEITKESVKTLADLQVDIKTANVELQTLNTTTLSLNKTVSDVDTMLPDIQATAKNVNAMSVNGNAASKDLKDYIHGVLHPTWPKRLWGYSIDVAHAVL